MLSQRRESMAPQKRCARTRSALPLEEDGVPAIPDEAVRVHSVQEEYFYMMVHRCACGGPWRQTGDAKEGTGARVRHRVEAECFKCRSHRTFAFVLDTLEDSKEPIREINRTSAPSRALDAVEWMDLARFYLGRIERLKDPVLRAQSLLDARQCVEEAMKFHTPGVEPPPEEALWSDESRGKVARDPASFAYSALKAMLEKIPSMERLRQADKMEQREFEMAVTALVKERRPKWWQFWKRFSRRKPPA